MTKVLLAGHASWPKGIYEAGKMIFFAPDWVEYLCLEGEIETYKIEFQKKMDRFQDDEVIVLCDLQGGTPYNEALRFALENSNVLVLAGMNLPGYLELIASGSMGIDIDLDAIQEIASKSMVRPVLTATEDDV